MTNLARADVADSDDDTVVRNAPETDGAKTETGVKKVVIDHPHQKKKLEQKVVDLKPCGGDGAATPECKQTQKISDLLEQFRTGSPRIPDEVLHAVKIHLKNTQSVDSTSVTMAHIRSTLAHPHLMKEQQ